MAFGKPEEKKVEAVAVAVETAVPVAGSVEATAKQKKNDASKKMIAKKKAAIKVLADLAARLGAPEDKTAAAYLTGEGRAPSVGGQTVSIIKSLFNEEVGKTVGEGEVFKLTKMGRSEMRAQIKKLVQNDFYVSFDATAETYKYEGKEKPATWTGPNKAAAKL